jgi:formylglycine-generating enzyme required for sulfatase activity
MRFYVLAALLLFGPNLKAQGIVPAKQLKNFAAFDGEFLLMGLTEVSNKMYNEYLYWLKTKSTEAEYNSALPDSTGWRDKIAFCEPYVFYYHQHPAYMHYPAVNITQQQARKYCQWVQERYLEYLQSINSPIEKIVVRLPTEAEWMKAARKGLPDDAIFPWEGESFRKTGKGRSAGLIQANAKMILGDNAGTAGRLNDMAFMTVEVIAYWPNKIGLYNMSGNVAEWINESGRTKGGSWLLPPFHSRIDVPGYYDGDSSRRIDIGFRIMVEVVSVKNSKPLQPFKADKKYFKENFAKVNDSLYAQITELSNKEYLQFLMENPAEDLKINNERWSGFFHYAHYRMYGWHEAYYERPVVNVTWEAAIKYCEWLTTKYNNIKGRDPDSNRGNKVIFRLPTGEEWETAARSGINGNMYPWGGPYCRNSRGIYLANFSPQEEQYLAKNDSNIYYYNYPNNDPTISRGIDGAIIPAGVRSYLPNDYGLYNCAGNVAEMVSEKGISRGGSWTSPEYKIQNSSKETYTHEAPNLGFRVFMEVIEP